MSDKNLPAKFNPNAFSLVAQEPQNNSTNTPHADFVRAIKKTFHHPHDAINAGLNPFKVYRENRGETQYNVAEILDCHEAEYDLIESGQIDFEVEDVLKFCQHFNIQPYDLLPHNIGATSQVMCDAMLAVHNNPSLLSTSCEHTKETVFLLLMDEALPTQSIIKLRRMRDSFKDQDIYGLTTAFIDLLLKNDGSLRAGYIDDHHNISEDFLDDARSSTTGLDLEKRKTLERKKEEARAVYNNLGNRLYRDDWVETHTRLLTAQQIVKNLKQFYRLYENSPSVLGRDTWPKHGSVIVHGKSHLDWAQAHKKHVIALRRYNDALLALSDNVRLQKNIGGQITNLEAWAEANSDLLQRYTNRQRIMHHHDFLATKPRSSSSSLSLTKIVSRHPVPNMPGVIPLDLQNSKLAKIILEERPAPLSFKNPALKKLFSPK
jgi:DNA-binding XRE family transcriptional regulator